MSTGYAAIVEVHIEGHGVISSLGKAGFTRQGLRKEEGCYTMYNAERRAISSVINKVRWRKYHSPEGVWIELHDFMVLHPERYRELESAILSTATWTSVGPELPQSWRTRLSSTHFSHALEAVGVVS